MDLTLPTPVIPRGAGRVLLPLGFLRKGALRRVDTRGPGNESLPILTARENGDLAVKLLMAAAATVVPDGDEQAMRDLMSEIVWSTGDNEGELRKRLERLISAKARPDTSAEILLALASQLASHFLFAVEVDASLAGRRAVVKYSYEDDPPVPKSPDVPSVVELDSGQFGVAASWHFEVEAPPSLLLRELRVDEYGPDGALRHIWSDDRLAPEGRPVAHVACKPDGRLSVARIKIVIAPAARGLATVAAWSATLAALVMGFAFAARTWPGTFVATSATGSSAVSLLLAGPAVLLTWLSRAPEHVLVARLLWPMRRVLVATSLALWGMAAIAAAPLVQPFNCIAWAAVAGIQTWALVEGWRLRAAVRRSK